MRDTGLVWAGRLAADSEKRMGGGVDLRILVEHGGQMHGNPRKWAVSSLVRRLLYSLVFEVRNPCSARPLSDGCSEFGMVTRPVKRRGPPPDGFPLLEQAPFESRPGHGAILEASVWPLGAEGHLPGRGDGPMACLGVGADSGLLPILQARQCFVPGVPCLLAGLHFRAARRSIKLFARQKVARAVVCPAY
jgi:hypothetical protein